MKDYFKFSKKPKKLYKLANQLYKFLKTIFILNVYNIWAVPQKFTQGTKV